MKILFERATAYRANRTLKRLSLWIGAAGALLAVVSFDLPELLEAGVVLSLAGWASFAALSNGLLPVKSREPLAAAREGLYEGERLIVSRDRLRAALLARHATHGHVLVLLPGRDVVHVAVDDSAAAEAMLRALELDVAGRRVEVRFRVGIAVRALAAAMLVAVVAVTAWIFREPAFVAIIGLGALAASWNTTLVVGDDGLGLHMPWRERFVPYSAVESVALRETVAGRQLCVALHSGRFLWLARSSFLRRGASLVDGDEAVVQRTEQALRRYRGRRTPVLPLSLSEQSTGSAADRVRELTLGERGSVYRRGAPDRDALRVAVDEPTLPPRVRAEAALALGAARDADDLERIRRAAERSACRRLRELFDAVADGAGEAKLSRALGRVP